MKIPSIYRSIDIHAAKQVMMVCNNIIDAWTNVIIVPCRRLKEYL